MLIFNTMRSYLTYSQARVMRDGDADLDLDIEKDDTYNDHDDGE